MTGIIMIYHMYKLTKNKSFFLLLLYL